MEGSFSRKQALERTLIDHMLNSIGIADVLAIGEQLRDDVQSSLQDHLLQKKAKPLTRVVQLLNEARIQPRGAQDRPRDRQARTQLSTHPGSVQRAVVIWCSIGMGPSKLAQSKGQSPWHSIPNRACE